MNCVDCNAVIPDKDIFAASKGSYTICLTCQEKTKSQTKQETVVWTCKNCNEQIEDNFTSCWKCQTDKPVVETIPNTSFKCPQCGFINDKIEGTECKRCKTVYAPNAAIQPANKPIERNTPEKKLQEGKKLNDEGKYFEAIDAFEDVILANYKTDQAYYGLHVAYKALGRGIEAQEALNRSRPSIYQVSGSNQKSCSKCGGVLVLQEEFPNRGAGYVILVLGIIFIAAFCLGLIVAYYGYKMINDKKEYWHCKNCGSTFPV